MLSLRDRIKLLQSSTKSEKAVRLCNDASQVCGNKMLESAISEQLIENLSSEANDPAVNQFITRETKLNKVQNLGVRESYVALCKSDLMQYPTVRPILERMKLAIETMPEYAIAESYISQLESFSWNQDAKSYAEKIRNAVNESAEDIKLCNFVYESSQNFFLPSFRNELDNYFIAKTTENRNALMEKISMYTKADAKIAGLYAMLQESCDDMQIKADGTVSISKIYSPIISNNGATIFCNEGKFFAKTKTDLTLMSDAQVAALPRNFVNLCSQFNASNVSVNESSISVFTKTKKVTIFPEDSRIQVDGKDVDYNMFTKSFVNEGLIYGASVNSELNQITNIYENAGTICEIDFGKHIESKSYKGHAADLFRIGNNICVYETNSEFGTSQYCKNLTALQARNLLIEHLNYDIKDTFCDLSSAETAKVQKYQREKEVFEANAQNLKNKKAQLLEAIKSDVYLQGSSEVDELLESIDVEISKMNNEIITRNNLIKNITSTSAVAMFEAEDFTDEDVLKNASEQDTIVYRKSHNDEDSEDCDKDNDGKCDIKTALKAGDEIQLKNGALGVVQGYDADNANCIILMHDGKTVSVAEEYFDEITVIKSASTDNNPELSNLDNLSTKVTESEKAVCPVCGCDPCICNKGKVDMKIKKDKNSSADPTPNTFELKDSTNIPPQGIIPQPEATVKSVMPSVAANRVEAQLVDDEGHIVIDKILVVPELFTAAGDEDDITYMTSGNSQDVFHTKKKYVKTLI